MALIRYDSDYTNDLSLAEYANVLEFLSPVENCPNITGSDNNDVSVNSVYWQVFEELSCACMEYQAGILDDKCCRGGPPSTSNSNSNNNNNQENMETWAIRLPSPGYPDVYLERLCGGFDRVLMEHECTRENAPSTAPSLRTEAETDGPTATPSTRAPTSLPTHAPSTKRPTVPPTGRPSTAAPTLPEGPPTQTPTNKPSSVPTFQTEEETAVPTFEPTTVRKTTESPSRYPTVTWYPTIAVVVEEQPNEEEASAAPTTSDITIVIGDNGSNDDEPDDGATSQDEGPLSPPVDTSTDTDNRNVDETDNDSKKGTLIALLVIAALSFCTACILILLRRQQQKTEQTPLPPTKTQSGLFPGSPYQLDVTENVEEDDCDDDDADGQVLSMLAYPGDEEKNDTFDDTAQTGPNEEYFLQFEPHDGSVSVARSPTSSSSSSSPTSSPPEVRPHGSPSRMNQLLNSLDLLSDEDLPPVPPPVDSENEVEEPSLPRSPSRIKRLLQSLDLFSSEESPAPVPALGDLSHENRSSPPGSPGADERPPPGSPSRMNKLLMSLDLFSEDDLPHFPATSEVEDDHDSQDNTQLTPPDSPSPMNRLLNSIDLFSNEKERPMSPASKESSQGDHASQPHDDDSNASSTDIIFQDDEAITGDGLFVSSPQQSPKRPLNTDTGEGWEEFYALALAGEGKDRSESNTGTEHDEESGIIIA